MEALNWTNVVAEMAPGLYRSFCASFSASVAEDLVQETLFRLLQKVDKGQFDANLGTLRMYAYGIARFVRLEGLKSNFKVEQIGELQISDDLVRTDDQLEQHQRISALRKAISLLSDVQQEVLNLYLDKELTYEDIGKLLGLPVGTVKSHVYRAKEELKAILESGDKNERT